jgi:hypothetical protein
MADYTPITGPGGYQGVLANMGRRGSAEDFAGAMLKFEADTEESVDLIMRGVGQYALGKVIEMSPVGKASEWQSAKDAAYLGVLGVKGDVFAFARDGYVGGRFKGNWQVTVEQPAEGELPGVDPTGSATILKGTAVMETVVRPRQFWLTNNLPYSERLEGGWSKQAPAGMVAVTMAEILPAFDQTAAEVLHEKGLA